MNPVPILCQNSAAMGAANWRPKRSPKLSTRAVHMASIGHVARLVLSRRSRHSPEDITETGELCGGRVMRTYVKAPRRSEPRG